MSESDPEINQEEIISPQRIGDIVDKSGRWERFKEAFKDPKVKEALIASGRTLVNTAITVTDLFPPTEEISWIADILKVSSPLMKKVGISTDLSPDVSKTAALGSEALEFVSGGFFPSHIVETVGQLKADIPRMKAGFLRAKEILNKEKQDYLKDKDQINGAMRTFGVNPVVI